jgi:hypothetical protein
MTYGTKGEPARCLVSVGPTITAKASSEGWRLHLRPNSSSTLKAGQASQHGSGVVDGPALETGRSAATKRPPNSSEGGLIEEFRYLNKLGQGFTSADTLEEIDIGDGETSRPTFVNKTLETDPRNEMVGLLKEYSDCFDWNYTEMPGLSREIVEHRLPIRSGFRPFKQKPRTFRPDSLARIKEEIHWLLEANFI